MPEPPDSVPPGARTLASGLTGQERIVTVGNTRVQPEEELLALSGTETSSRK